MNCHKARQLYYLWLEGELPEKNARMLNKHLADCTACAGEAQRLKDIGLALRKMKNPVTPPEAFSASIISILRADLAEQKDRPGVQTTEYSSWYGFGLANKVRKIGRCCWGPDAGWKKGVAAAAAVVLLLGGSVGVAARYIGVPGILLPVLVADRNPAGPFAVDQASPVTENPSVQQEGTPPNSGAESGGSNVSKNEEENIAHVDVPGQQRQSTEKTGGVSAQNSVSVPEPSVFLNRSRTIESMLVKVNVADLDAATRNLIDSAKLKGISYSVEHKVQIDNDRGVNIFRFDVPQQEANQFGDLIGGLGRVVSSDRNSRDVTNEFAEKLDRYQELLTGRKTASGQQASQLDGEIKSLEAELMAMDKEARQQLVLIVWLEN